MHIYEITYTDGKKEKKKADNIAQAVCFASRPAEDVTKVECIDKAIVRHDVHQANVRLHEYGTDYHNAHEVMPYIREILATNGFDTEQLSDIEASGESGEARCVPVGRDVYLCVTWYRMPTGRYEVVAYVS